MDTDNVTLWISDLMDGDDVAAERISYRYRDKLVDLAQRKLAAIPKPVGDDEGAVDSAFRSFFSGVRAGKFPELADRENLWKVLITITGANSLRRTRHAAAVLGSLS